MELYLYDHPVFGDCVQISIPRKEWNFARKRCPRLFRQRFAEHSDDGLDNTYYLPLDQVDEPGVWRFLAFLGSLEVLHITFLLDMLEGESGTFAGESAARLLRRLYKRLTVAGGSERGADDIKCDSSLDYGISLSYDSNEKMFMITADRFANVIIGRNLVNIYSLRRHFSEFGILVDVFELRGAAERHRSLKATKPATAS